jgi:predicted DNA-binding transcriptional regulator YafY
MAINKNALIRYKTLDNCFRNRSKRYFIEDLIEACTAVLSEIDAQSNGISRRQIFDDITFMESKAGWNIELERRRDGKRIYYRYADPSFSINNSPLNEVEINELRSASLILSQFKGMPRFEWLNELLPKLGQGMASKDASVTIIEFDDNPYLKGIEHLGTLRNAIFYKTVLKIVYHPYNNEEPHELTLHPYFLKQYNNRWFLFGYNPENDRYNWNLAIDRIVHIGETKGKYHKNTAIDWQTYFDDFIGVTKPDGGIVADVTLQFFGRTGRYIESKPLHPSQRSKWIDMQTLEVRLKVMINYELEREILSYADSVKVIAPASLASPIRTRLADALNLY